MYRYMYRYIPLILFALKPFPHLHFKGLILRVPLFACILLLDTFHFLRMDNARCSIHLQY